MHHLPWVEVVLYPKLTCSMPVSPQRNEATTYPHPAHFGNTFHSVLLTFVLLACVAGIVIAAAVVFCLRQHAKQREKERLAGLGPEGATDSTYEYQVPVGLMAGRNFDITESVKIALHVAPWFTRNHRPGCLHSPFSY